MAQTSDTLLMRTIRLVNGLVGKSSLNVETGWEVRRDNLHVPKQFFFIQVHNPGPFSACVSDVSLCWSNPARSKTVKSIIVGEDREYPVVVKAGICWRIHLLPSLINLPQLTGISVQLANGQKLMGAIDSEVLAAGIDPAELTAPSGKWAGGIRLN